MTSDEAKPLMKYHQKKDYVQDSYELGLLLMIETKACQNVDCVRMGMLIKFGPQCCCRNYSTAKSLH